MIGKLCGRIDEISEDSVILDVLGVGYLVFCSSRTLAALPAVGEAAQLIIETHVREDHIHLYGFPDSVERGWFRLLATVQGVGNKTALAILSAYAPQQMAQAILARDAAAFRAISGIGPKLAERIVTELKDKVTKLPVTSYQLPVASKKNVKESLTTDNRQLITDDAISALVNLGYSRTEAYAAALKASQKTEKAGLDELIKLSLKELVRA
ncbi:MAG: Holliday junction branch migration protein RuvA [Pseudomonadota bacterium]|nr:Holliday junction branch migration protein RuvA [Pseudomonadota bacterium]MDE3037962.1 Holliday junction branch migration protein RuvA [Pseudomonadota bacterium]